MGRTAGARFFLFLEEQSCSSRFCFLSWLTKKAKDSGGGTPDFQDGVQFPAASLLYTCWLE